MTVDVMTHRGECTQTVEGHVSSLSISLSLRLSLPLPLSFHSHTHLYITTAQCGEKGRRERKTGCDHLESVEMFGDEGLALNVMSVSVVSTRRLRDEVMRHHTTAVDARDGAGDHKTEKEMHGLGNGQHRQNEGEREREGKTSECMKGGDREGIERRGEERGIEREEEKRREEEQTESFSVSVLCRFLFTEPRGLLNKGV
jgi:hypothetical protein